MEKGLIKKTLNSTTVTWHVQLPATVSNVWELLTTDKGLASWFPELRMGKLGDEGYLLFQMTETEQIKMPIIVYNDLEIIGFDWGADQVIIKIIRLPDQQTRLELKEVITEITEHTPRDLAGWTFCLERIKAVIRGKEATFSELFDDVYQYYAKQLF